MASKELDRLKQRRQAKADRDAAKAQAFKALKARVTEARVKDILPQYQRAVRNKRPPPPPATAEQIEALELKIEKFKPASQVPPQIHVPEPTVIVEPGKPDTVMHEKLGELATVNRDMSRSLVSMLKLLSERDSELQIEITGRDKKGNIKTFEVKSSNNGG